MSSEDIKNIIVVGASAGGMNAISKLLSTFKQDLDASIFIVIHLSGTSMAEVILKHFQKQSLFPCRIPEDNEVIVNRTIYLAPADKHLMITKGIIKVQRGAFENHWRPSIDVMFRTAAAAYDSCVIGIILTGLLDDGTSGMSAIKHSGGICIVQDPEEAEFPDMPLNVLKTVQIDYKVSVNEMGYIIVDLLSREHCEPSEIPEELKREADITLRMSSEVETLNGLGRLVPISCPDCGGSLFKMDDPFVKRFRCYTGHSYTEALLEKSQEKNIEESLWVAIRMMEERKNILYGMLQNEQYSSNGLQKNEKAGQLQTHIDRLKRMLHEL